MTFFQLTAVGRQNNNTTTENDLQIGGRTDSRKSATYGSFESRLEKGGGGLIFQSENEKRVDAEKKK